MTRGGDGPESSPIALAPSATGRRKNRVPLAIGMAVATAVMAVIGYTVHARAEAARSRAESRERGDTDRAEAASAEDALRDIPEDVRAAFDKKSAGLTRPPPNVTNSELPLIEPEARPLVRQEVTAREQWLEREKARQRSRNFGQMSGPD